MEDLNSNSRHNSDDDDGYIEALLEDIALFDQFHFLNESESLETHHPKTSSNSLIVPDHHTIFIKKRPYERKTIKHDQKSLSKYHHIVFPRIVKTDFRRKFFMMYENVINSYDYHLIYSFFHQYLEPDVRFNVRIPSNDPKFAVSLQGVIQVVEYLLLLLQSSPDKVTRVFDLQLKQSSKDLERTELLCRFVTSNTRVYEVYPDEVARRIKEPSAEENSANIGTNTIATVRKRKVSELVGAPQPCGYHQKLFDPVNGTFLKSRFTRSENPDSYDMEGTVSVIIHQDKRIERMNIFPIGKVLRKILR